MPPATMRPPMFEPFSARNRNAQKAIDHDFPMTARIGLLHILHDAVASDYIGGP